MFDNSCRPEYLAEAALQLARKLAGQMAMPLPQIDLKAIDTSPIAGLHFAQGLSHYYAGDMDAAIMQLMRTIDLDPNYPGAPGTFSNLPAGSPCIDAGTSEGAPSEDFEGDPRPAGSAPDIGADEFM